jgi:hypothetical protein
MSSKADTTKLVDLAYTLWNKEPSNDPDQKKLVYRAWHLVLQDCPYDQLEPVLVKLNRTERFLPTPGSVYEHWQQTQPNAEPTAAQAWNMYCNIRDTVNSGTANPNTHIPIKLQQVIRTVGLNLSTGADRTHFTETYNQHITKA